MRRGRRLIPAHAGKTRACRCPRRSRSAHPRSRGENHHPGHPRIRLGGSSPLTRGKHRTHPSIPSALGLIPAHAGKTERELAWGCSKTAHPRSRGENVKATALRGRRPGSSPLTRGKPPPTPTGATRSRLIPAHAGKTSYAATIVACFAAHPRSRGENPATFSPRLAVAGSSPLTRGKRAHPFRAGDLHRLIPAHAGKTTSQLAANNVEGAHPRSRGENSTD